MMGFCDISECSNTAIHLCKLCGFEVCSKHSHKTCITRFDEKVEKEVKRRLKEAKP